MSNKVKYIRNLSFLFIYVAVILLLSSIVNREPVEQLSVDYIIENIELFKEDFNQMGYEVKILRTRGDVQDDLSEEESKEKLGYLGRGVLLLHNEYEMVWFDVGFDSYEVTRNDGIIIFISNIFDDKPVNLKSNRKNFPMYTYLYAPEYDNETTRIPFNYYNLDFTEFSERYKYEARDDLRIKKYVSSQELRQILEKGIAFQDKLVDMYNQRKPS